MGFSLAVNKNSNHCHYYYRHHLFVKDEQILFQVDGAFQSILWNEHLETVLLHRENIAFLVKNTGIKEYLSNNKNTTAYATN